MEKGGLRIWGLERNYRWDGVRARTFSHASFLPWKAPEGMEGSKEGCDLVVVTFEEATCQAAPVDWGGLDLEQGSQLEGCGPPERGSFKLGVVAMG